MSPRIVVLVISAALAVLLASLLVGNRFVSQQHFIFEELEKEPIANAKTLFLHLVKQKTIPTSVEVLEKEYIRLYSLCATKTDESGGITGTSQQFMAERVSTRELVSVASMHVVSALFNTQDEAPKDLLVSKGFLLQRNKLLLDDQFFELKTVPKNEASFETTTDKVSRFKGPQNILWIRLIFPDNQVLPYSDSRLTAYFTDLESYYKENTYEKMWLGNYNIVTVQSARNLSYYRSIGDSSHGDMHNEARSLAAQQGYNCNSYDNCIVSFFALNQATQFAGLGTIGGPYVWIWITNINSNFHGPTHHELGHNTMFSHSNSLYTAEAATNSKTSYGGRQTLSDYGDSYDTMGKGLDTTQHHHGPHHKRVAGWMPDSGFTTITAPFSNYIDIHAHDRKQNAGKLMSVYTKWRSDFNNTNFNFSFRSRVTGNARMAVGSISLYATYQSYSNGTQVLDTTPQSSWSMDDAMISLGQMYYDPTTNPPLYVTAISKKCSNPTQLCKVKSYFHYGVSVDTQTITATYIPMDYPIDPSTQRLQNYNSFRYFVDFRNYTGPVALFAYWGTVYDTFVGQSPFFTIYSPIANILMRYSVSTYQGAITNAFLTVFTSYMTSSPFGTIRATVSPAVSGSSVSLTVTSSVSSGTARDLVLVHNEAREFFVANVNSYSITLPVSNYSGVHLFKTVAATSSLVDQSSNSFYYVNKLESAISVERTSTGISASFLIPQTGTVLYRKVPFSNFNSTFGRVANQSTASFSITSEFSMKVSGAGTVNIFYPYTLTTGTILEFEARSFNLSSATYVSLQKSTVLERSDLIYIMGSNSTGKLSTYEKAFPSTFTTIRIPLASVYLAERDDFSSLYISFTNDNDGEVEVSNIRFYELEATVNNYVSDSTVRNSIIKYHSLSYTYQWFSKCFGNDTFTFAAATSAFGLTFPNSTTFNSSCELQIKVFTSTNQLIDETIMLNSTETAAKVVQVVPSPRVSIQASPRVSIQASPRGSSVIPRVSQANPRASQASPRISQANPKISSTTRNSTAEVSSSIIYAQSATVARVSTIAPRATSNSRVSPAPQTSNLIISKATKYSFTKCLFMLLLTYFI